MNRDQADPSSSRDYACLLERNNRKLQMMRQSDEIADNLEVLTSFVKSPSKVFFGQHIILA